MRMKIIVSSSEPSSQPNSLDLDYDMWQGQFEFVGNNNKNSSPSDNRSSQVKSNSVKDLNFNLNDLNFSNKHPILIDEETFLSLHPNDFDDWNNLCLSDNSSSGPNSTIYFENKETTDKSSILLDLENKNLMYSNLCKIENAPNKNILNQNKNSNNCFKIEDIKNFKNKLICDELTEKIILSKNNNNKGNVNCISSVGLNKNKKINNGEDSYLADTMQHSNGKLNCFTAEICDTLNEQLELLQRQVTDLADSQSTVDDRTTRTKTEYAVLQARYHMLEEQYREAELRAEERLSEEQKRHRELLARVEREASLQNENYQIKIRTIEIEANSLRDETQRLRVLCDKQANDLHATQEKMELARDNIASLEQEVEEAQIRERKHDLELKESKDLMIQLSNELERIRAENGPALPTTSPETIRLEELHFEIEELRQQNKILLEQNEELQAAVFTRGVEEGRHLLNGTLNSLAQELEELTQAQDSVDSATLASLSQLQQAFKDKEEENQRLKNYIDTILLNIVENYPQLLEVKASMPKQQTPNGK
ncbi:rab11 family-interacting protein 4B isoform X4 [Condylostylus longicornis]|uniref:rab11 family-interacting protein 4B isoform X4 n=1 Tax=Condylostylus longicornis TaxID=2530218 RepID=UPI00244E5326|nr:rab11 family-interacting protein 4B isoform X4 [Condylostylus longicornis]